MKRVNSKLWIDCFHSMPQHEYESKSAGELEDIYTDWLQERALKCKATESKAADYDRLMLCGLSMKELANILKHPVAIENEDDQNELYYFDSTPYISQFSDGTQFWSCKRKWRLPRQLVNFCGIWEDSLSLPDGWEGGREEK